MAGELEEHVVEGRAPDNHVTHDDSRIVESSDDRAGTIPSDSGIGRQMSDRSRSIVPGRRRRIRCSRSSGTFSSSATWPVGDLDTLTTAALP